MLVNFAAVVDNFGTAVVVGGRGQFAGSFEEVVVDFAKYQGGRRPATPPPAAYKCSQYYNSKYFEDKIYCENKKQRGKSSDL